MSSLSNFYSTREMKKYKNKHNAFELVFSINLQLKKRIWKKAYECIDVKAKKKNYFPTRVRYLPVKIRDTLCCYLQKSCPKEILKYQFRSIYFHISCNSTWILWNQFRKNWTKWSFILSCKSSWNNNNNNPISISLIAQAFLSISYTFIQYLLFTAWNNKYIIENFVYLYKFYHFIIIINITVDKKKHSFFVFNCFIC